jgi:hypothetical protein
VSRSELTRTPVQIRFIASDGILVKVPAWNETVVFVAAERLPRRVRESARALEWWSAEVNLGAIWRSELRFVRWKPNAEPADEEELAGQATEAPR